MIPQDYATLEFARRELETGPQGLFLHEFQPQRTLITGGSEVYRNNIELLIQWRLHGNNKPFETTFFIAQKPHVFAITDIFVPEPYRGRGFCKQIVGQLEELAQKLEVPVIEAHENTHRQQHQAWWEKRGYRLTNDGTYGGTWIMAKNFQEPAAAPETKQLSYLKRLSKSLFQH